MNSSVKVSGIDPSSSVVGLANVQWSPLEGLLLTDIRSVDIHKSARSHLYNKPFVNAHGDRANRLHHLPAIVQSFLYENKPDFIGCEGAYFNQSQPTGYAGVVEAMQAARFGCTAYNPAIEMQEIASSAAKKLVQASKKKGTKLKRDEMKQLVRDHLMAWIKAGTIKTAPHITTDYLEGLKNDGFDALAVALCLLADRHPQAGEAFTHLPR